MTGDVNLTHIRDTLRLARLVPSQYDRIEPEDLDAALAQLAAAEAVIQAARAYVDYPMEGTRRKALRTALAALEDVQ